jgi:hypothetical protein
MTLNNFLIGIIVFLSNCSKIRGTSIIRAVKHENVHRRISLYLKTLPVILVKFFNLWNQNETAELAVDFVESALGKSTLYD